MALDLFGHYIAYRVFFAAHLALLGFALWTYVMGRRAVHRHRAALERLREVRASLATDAAAEPPPDPAMDAPPAATPRGARPAGLRDDSWAELEALYAAPGRPTFAAVREHYAALLGGLSDDLSRTANVLLLTGIAGTLYGLYGGAASAAKLGAEGMFDGAFQAFGVTIAAVVLAGIVIGFQRAMTRFCDRAEVKIARLWERGEAADASSRSATIAIVGQLSRLTDQFSSVVDRMQLHSDRILHDAETLGQVAASCAVLKDSVDALPGRLHEAIARSQDVYLQGLGASTEALSAQHTSAVGAMQELARAAGQAHASHLEGMTHIRQRNEDLFAQVRDDNRRAFKSIQDDLATLSGRITGVDQTAGQVIGKFASELSASLSLHVASLDTKLSALREIAPEVDRNLQRLQPASETAASAMKAMEAASLESIGHVQTAMKRFADSLTGVQAQVQRIAAAQEAAASPRDEVRAPRVAGSLRAAVVVGLAAGFGASLLGALLRVVS
ncbi:MAG TPA: hypothetical protein VFT22_25630 [Kofleriaceae bacterium]|nr:hypothetical protein [Kofleriaceae bacterium]